MRIFWKLPILIFLFLTTQGFSQKKNSVRDNDSISASDISLLNKSAHAINSSGQSVSRELDPLIKSLQKSTLIGIGESTHGTHEFFDFKLKMIEQLVAQNSINTFVLEESMLECRRINDYTLGKIDSLQFFLTGYYYPIWKNEEMVAVINWIKAYNSTHSEKISVYGMDIQVPYTAWQYIKSLGKYDSTIVDLINRSIKTFWSANPKNNRAVADILCTLADSVKQKVDKVLLGDPVLASKDSRIWLSQATQILIQNSKSFLYQGNDFRDSCMAENIKWISLNIPNSKMLIWAHNSHVQKAGKSMGVWLKNNFRENYSSIGLFTANGMYTASEDISNQIWKKWQLESPYPPTLEYYLAMAEKNNYYLLMSDRKVRENKWFTYPVVNRSVGFVQLTKQFMQMPPVKDCFDAVVFFKTTTGTNSYLMPK